MFDLIPDTWMPLVIFVARVCDVSLGTLRILFVSKGMRLRAAALGFLEVLIWIIVVAQLINHLNNWMNFIAFAGGFAVGTYVGMYIENKLKVGTLIVRIITAQKGDDLVGRLQDAGFMLTRVDAEGGVGPVEIVFTVCKRKRWHEVKDIIETFDAEVFYSVEEVKFASGKEGGMYPIQSASKVFDRLLRIRKGL